MPRPEVLLHSSRSALLPLQAAVLSFALILAGCILDDRTAGTSTTVTNPSPTVYGAVIFLGGRPAAGSLVHLRSTQYELGPGGKPQSRLAASAVVDDTGGFSMPMPPMLREYYLAFTEVPGPGVIEPEDSLEVQLHRWADGLPRNGYMGTLRMALPGALTGRVAFGDTSADSVRWIGARGTDNFVAVGKDGGFRISRLAPGLQYLTLITAGAQDSLPQAAPGFTVRDMVGSGTVVSGKSTDVGVLTHPGN